MTHKELVEVAYKWVLKRCSCGVAFKELKSLEQEIPDVIGFGSGGHSVLAECKVSRSDFFCDKNKEVRKHPQLGMGMYRFYFCPEELIKVEELPDGWGLVYVSPKLKTKVIHNPYAQEPFGNIYRNGFNQSLKAEQALMYSALRRLFIKGYVKHIYDKNYSMATADEVIEANKTDE